ncbi:anhydro-N-acetylmuramic acid kinase [Aequoribacter sp.]|uniref:anhydro-N-acetylmuramic acid kinase n=1 Tax=Aequoribacter sp. TaxID=2847771 RepID=UPI003F6A07D3
MPNSTPNKSGLFIGLMSGTSVDGVDAALVRIDGQSILLEHTYTYELPENLTAELHRLSVSETYQVDRIGQLHRILGDLFAEASLELIKDYGITASDVEAIGSHGQTIRHRPDAAGLAPAFTWQIGDAHTIAQKTRITTIADFRGRDLAASGQAAPLAPLFHKAMLGAEQSGAVLNIGGLANATISEKGAIKHGFDTGPGNTLIDTWCRLHLGCPFDTGGDWARSGVIQPALLSHWLCDTYFAKTPPKSTGREHFNHDWLVANTASLERYRPQDIAATLTELTAVSCAQSIIQNSTAPSNIYVCGGGSHNTYLMERIEAHSGAYQVATTRELGIDPDWVEAAAFAWLAYARINDQRFDLHSITGSKGEVPLGVIYPA